MKKGDDVFLLTLVDLLLQLLFLGLVVYAVGAAAQRARAPRPEVSAETIARLDSIAQAQGFSNVADLTDQLTRMAPVKSLQRLDSLAGRVGGIDSVVRVVDRALRGSGAPPCIFTRSGNRVTPVAIAEITAWDDSLRVRALGDTLPARLASAGAPPIPDRGMPLREFRDRFSRVAREDCRYHVRLVERTEYVRARDTVYTVFSYNRAR